MKELRANTEVIVPIGPFVDVGDGFTPQTDITLGGNEAEILKHNSATVVDISGATWAAIASCRGYYALTLTTALTNTEGGLTVVVQDDSDTLPVKQEFMVLSQAAWDSKYAEDDSGRMKVDLTSIMKTGLTEGGSGRLAAAFIKLLDVATPTLVASSVMRGTDGVDTATMRGTDGANTTTPNTVVPPTKDEVLAWIQLLARNDAAITTDRSTELSEINANEGSGAGDYAATADSLEANEAAVGAIPTTAMRGTDSAATATNLATLQTAVDTKPTVIAQGTATSGSTNTITLETSPGANDLHNGERINIIGGTGAGQSRVITAFTHANKIAVVAPIWATSPSADSVYEIVGASTNITHHLLEPQTVGINIGSLAKEATLGAVNEAAAAGDPSTSESVMKYVKQIVNILTGTAGIITMPSAAAPDDGISIAEMVRAIYDDTNNMQPKFVGITLLNEWLGAMAGKQASNAQAQTEMRASGAGSGTYLATADSLEAAEEKLATAQTDLDTITGTDGVELATSQTAAWASALEASAGVIIKGAAETGTLSTTQMTTDLSEATNDHYIGRVVIWTSGVLLGQASDITDYIAATGQLDYTAVTEAPTAADTFVIV